MQNDGNLVLYNTTGPLWASNTAGNPGAYAVLQGGDGNFVVYAANGTALWNSATGGNPGDRLAVQPDGNVVIYSSGGTGLFATNTGGGGGGGGGSVGERILAQAEKWVGTPYCFAGGEPNGPTHAKGNTEGATQCGGTTKGFDCTGLTIYAVYQVTGKSSLTKAPRPLTPWRKAGSTSTRAKNSSPAISCTSADRSTTWNTSACTRAAA